MAIVISIKGFLEQKVGFFFMRFFRLLLSRVFTKKYDLFCYISNSQLGKINKYFWIFCNKSKFCKPYTLTQYNIIYLGNSLIRRVYTDLLLLKIIIIMMCISFIQTHPSSDRSYECSSSLGWGGSTYRMRLQRAGPTGLRPHKRRKK